jgi:hypothetical protein
MGFVTREEGRSGDAEDAAVVDKGRNSMNTKRRRLRWRRVRRLRGFEGPCGYGTARAIPPKLKSRTCAILRTKGEDFAMSCALSAYSTGRRCLSVAAHRGNLQ